MDRTTPQAALNPLVDQQRIQPPVEGVVVGVHYPHDSTNRSQSEMEYDVDIVSVAGVGRLKNVPRMYSEAGMIDGIEDVLHAADGSNSDAVKWVADGADATPRLKTNGDRVVVNFINGNPARPFIAGVLTHRYKKRKSLKARNARGAYQRERVVRGNHVLEDENGNVYVAIGNKVDAFGKDVSNTMLDKEFHITFGDLEIILRGKEDEFGVKIPTLEIVTLASNKNGETLLQVQPEKLILGSDQDVDLQGVGMGKNIAKFLSEILDFLRDHTHTGNMGAPTPLMPSDITKLQTFKLRTDKGDLTNEFFSHFAFVPREKP